MSGPFPGDHKCADISSCGRRRCRAYAPRCSALSRRRLVRRRPACAGDRLPPPEQVGGILCIAGVAPYDAEGFNFLEGICQQNIDEFDLALQGEEAIRPSNEAEAVGLRNTDAAGIIEGMATLLPDVDRAVLTAELAKTWSPTSPKGYVLAWTVGPTTTSPSPRPGRFSLAEIAVPTFVWQGSEDLMVSVRPRTMA